MSHRTDGTYGEFDQATLKLPFGGPGADTRQWLSYGTVLEEGNGQKSVTYVDGQQYVRVRLHPSELVVNARVLCKVAGAGEGESHPFVEHDEVLVAVPQGNERAGCVVLGKLNNALDAMPGVVAGNDTSNNAFTWTRTRTARAVESFGGDVVRDAKSGTYYGIGPDGGFSISTTDGGFLTVGPDSLGMQSVQGDMYCQANLQKGTWLIGTSAGAVNAFFMLGNADQGIYSPGKFYLATGGVVPTQHVALWEGLLAYLETYITTFVAAAVATAGGTVPPGTATAATTAAVTQMTLGGQSPYARGLISG